MEGLVSGQEWTRFLVESSRFSRYSANNRMLIAAQLVERGIDPDGLAASYKTWQRVPAQGGGTCQVRRGEQALWIYAPLTVTRRQTDEATGEDRTVAVGVRGFKAVPVFHHTQLAQPPDLVQPPAPELLRGEQAPARVWDGIVAELAAAGYTVQVVEREPGGVERPDRFRGPKRRGARRSGGAAAAQDTRARVGSRHPGPRRRLRARPVTSRRSKRSPSPTWSWHRSISTRRGTRSPTCRAGPPAPRKPSKPPRNGSSPQQPPSSNGSKPGSGSTSPPTCSPPELSPMSPGPQEPDWNRPLSSRPGGGGGPVGRPRSRRARRAARAGTARLPARRSGCRRRPGRSDVPGTRCQRHRHYDCVDRDLPLQRRRGPPSRTALHARRDPSGHPAHPTQRCRYLPSGAAATG